MNRRMTRISRLFFVSVDSLITEVPYYSQFSKCCEILTACQIKIFVSINKCHNLFEKLIRTL